SVLVGRDEELGRIAEALGAGRPAITLIVEGDAGVGKTSLVRHACSRLGDNTLVLRGTCLPLSSLTVPFLSVRSALHDAARNSALEGADGVPPPPDFDGSPARALLLIDAWLEAVSATRPIVLAIDDLQWADQGTLDLLLYLIAGPADRRMALIATIRSDDEVVGRPIDRWLADVRRMPRVEFLRLGPLDRIATALLIGDVMGVSPDQTLVEDAYSHSRGHPYLTELVVAGLAPGARHLPADLPTSLTSAVLESVRDLAPAVQQLLGILAVAGAPAEAATLAAVIAESGVSAQLPAEADLLAPLLSSAVNAGAIVAAADGSYWFRHPLTAEVLEAELTPTTRARWHVAFARLEATSMPAGMHPRERLVRVADHFYRAGTVDEAYRWAMRAAESARDAGAHGEELRLVTRAAQLRPSIRDASESAIDLMHRQRLAAAAAGAMEDELVLVERLLEVRSSSSLLRAELLVRRMNLRGACQIEAPSPATTVDAVILSSQEPASWQHALALAAWCLAHPLVDGAWPRAADAVRALELARESAHPLALTWALVAVGWSEFAAGRREIAAALASEAITAAIDARDWLAFNVAAQTEALSMDVGSSRAFVECVNRRRDQLAEIGAPHIYVSWLSLIEAESWLTIGEWRECQRCLRFTLGSDPGPFADAGARLTAARLATLQGRQDEAVAHLARADELFVGRRLTLSFGADVVRAEVYLADGDPAAALQATMHGIAESIVESREPEPMCEWLVPLAARALADQAESARDAGIDTASLLARVEELVGGHPDVLLDSATPNTELAARQRRAFSALYSSEVGRARRVPDAGEAWLRTADACSDAGLAWEEAYACLRAAEALLLRRRGSGIGASAVIRRGLRLAAELDARPVASRLVELSTLAHIRLDDIEVTAAEVTYPGLHGLTEREREILTHVVAGRTYAQIAADLVISEKTVSSHISSLLRKTGASNRLHLSMLAAAARSTDG
ncbi:MAG: hypothetical protein QOJ07_2193, partial [Thermoleophilaceae bacterium]|nr:hypothetical protein [Thermoleophilaceae bacterium]